MKVLALTNYDALGASSRMRFAQYIPHLRSRSIHVEVSFLLSSSYVACLQRGCTSWSEVWKGYLQRLSVLITKDRYDLLWIEKECLPWLPGWFEILLLGATPPFILDYDDAVFHKYDHHENSIVRTFLANKHPRLMQRSGLVIAGNPYLEAFARSNGARNVVTLPTVIDLNRYVRVDEVRVGVKSRPVQIGWIGQASTAKFLRPLVNVFLPLIQEKIAEVKAVGIDPESHGLPISGVPWTEDTEFALLRNFDIGIMPLIDGVFERGKCGYKLIQYMACGLPVVASPVGVNSTIVEHGVTGYLVKSLDEWNWALRKLATDPALRCRMGQAGRAKVEREYSLQVTAPLLTEWLLEVASGPKV